MKKTDKKNNVQHTPLPRFGQAEETLQAITVNTAALDHAEGPERIYAFAEGLQRQGRDSEQKAEQQLEPWVVFEVDKECYGLPVSHVQEILRVENITRIPQAPKPIRGITNMRGYLLPVVDLKLRLELGRSQVTPLSRILVANSRDKLIGFLVDSVQQVIKLDRLQFEPPPPDVMTPRSDYVQAVYHLQDSLVILLDVERVLLIKDSPEEAAVRKSKGEKT